MRLSQALRAAAIVMTLCSVGSAAADTVKVTGFLDGRKATVDLDAPRNGNFSAGEFTGFWNGNSFSAMCVDVMRDLTLGTTYTNFTAMTPTAYGFSATQVGLFNRLYTNYYGASHTDNVSAAAFQLATWEITYDGNGALNLAANTFKLGTTGNAAAVALAGTWLSTLAAQNTGMWSFTVLDSTGTNRTQDLLVAIPVPEPSTYLMMIAGLGVLGLFARRRRLA